MARASREPENASQTLDRMEGAAEDHRSASRGAAGEGKVTIGELVEGFGHRSYGPFLIVPALIELSPLGGIPGVPTLLALIIVTFAVQMLVGRDHLWLPGVVRNRAIDADRLEKAAEKMRPVTDRLDRWFGGRLQPLTGKLAIRIAAVACILLALTVPPLELVPFASSGPMAAVAAFGLALLVRDGVLMLLAMALTVLAAGVGFGVLLTGG